MIQEAVAFLKARTSERPETAVVLGSGLGRLAEGVQSPLLLPYGDIPGFVTSTVHGHAGKLILGKLKGKELAIMQGRLHFYEGYSGAEITFPIRVLKHFGIKNLILTSAVGGIAPELKPGDLAMITDHINFMGDNPLRGFHDDSFGARFPDMSSAYDAGLRATAQKAARSLKLKLKEAVYCACRGPSYETPAEIRLFKQLGAGVVGMSVVPEVIVANQEGIRILTIAYISNKAAGLSKTPLTHEEVLATGKKVEASLANLLAKIIELI